jgi:predicted nucleic acid-binding protein
VVSLDSSFLIDFLRGEARAILRARELDRTGEVRYLTAPAASEVLLEAYRIGGGYLTRTSSLVGNLPLLPFDREAVHEAARLGSELSRRGTPIGQGDLFIAAISKRHGQHLLTRDTGFLQVPGLTVESY